MPSQLRLLFLSFYLLIGSSSVAALEIWVAVDGNNLNRGTKESPKGSLLAAKKALRASERLGLEPCEVIFQSGTYRFDKPLTFTPADSGSKQFPVIYRAAEGADVLFTGAFPIEAAWEAWRDGIYRTSTKGFQSIDQLFVDGTRQTMARYPNLGSGFFSAGKDGSELGKMAGNTPYGGCAADAWDAGKAKSWDDPTGAFLHGMHTGLWGSQHYRVLGKKADGSLIYEGGWQNNRSSRPHPSYRMIENLLEELDAPGEWYHDHKKGWLYYLPTKGTDLAKATIEVVRPIKNLLQFHGTNKTPVDELEIIKPGNGMPKLTVKNYETTDSIKNIRIKGICFSGTARTFMETREPLLRSDWTIYRGGAIHLRGTENLSIEGCRFEELGGNAIFVDSYNRGVTIRGNYFRDNGASDINLVGSFASVRDPQFNYRARSSKVDTVDTEVGPKGEAYPADSLIEDNLMIRCGRFEKQSSGVNLSMSSRITIRHNTISHTPRAAINLCDGTWGGHMIEWNDCFETVLETHDHGAFNGWGRDRYWHSAGPSGPNQKDKRGTPLISHLLNEYPKAPYWDAYQPTVIRHNRMQCDHGWDIDLDDGCSNYKIYNNLCLSGGLKTREGYRRIVTNNVILGRGYTCNVPYPGPSYDVFERNLMWGLNVYRSTNPELWSGSRDFNFVHNPDRIETVAATGIQQQTDDDANSLYGNARFVAPEQGDFSISKESPAKRVGYKNFPMTGFGVHSARLKKLATRPTFDLPTKSMENQFHPPKLRSLFDAEFKNLDTEAEVTATGMYAKKHVLIVQVSEKGELAEWGFLADDVVLEIDGKPTLTTGDFVSYMSSMKVGPHQAKIWRGQREEKLVFNR